MVEIKIIMASELGVNCWSVLRFIKKCYGCRRYNRCKYQKVTKKSAFWKE